MGVVKKDQDNFLYKIRIKKNVSQFEMSRKLNCSQSYLSKVENNQQTPDINLLANMRKVYNININRMVDEGMFDA